MSRLFKRCHKWWDLKHCDTGIFQRSPGSFLVPRNPCRDMILLPVIRQSMWSRRGRSLKKIANLNLIYSHAWWITLDKTYICKYICKYIHIISSWYFWKYKRYTNHGLYSYYTHHIIMVGSSIPISPGSHPAFFTTDEKHHHLCMTYSDLTTSSPNMTVYVENYQTHR
jgi:hypothetical protein